jgi:hypothetical protein
VERNLRKIRERKREWGVGEGKREGREMFFPNLERERNENYEIFLVQKHINIHFLEITKMSLPLACLKRP